jgi:polyphosphate kinase
MPSSSASATDRATTVSTNVISIDAARFAKLMWEMSDPLAQEAVRQAIYERTLFRLQCELVKLQSWVLHQKLKVIVVFEGRDAAGKGGVIKRITQRLNPRSYQVVALSAPTERERTQWYFQRYVAHFPTAGELVFFDRSWYNRAGVERVMGLCSKEEYDDFLESVPYFETMIVRSGIILIKYWFSVSYEEQLRRLMERAHHPLKQWKLSSMDIQSLQRWEDYTEAKEIMFQRTHIPEAPWWIVDAVDKRRARLNCIQHLLSQIPYEDLPQHSFELPEQVMSTDHVRKSASSAIYVPSVY